MAGGKPMKDHEITNENFYRRIGDFHHANPGCSVMVRPDRPWDCSENRYLDEAEKSRGDAAMRKWFEYLSAKNFRSTIKSLASLLNSGRSIIFVCEDPAVFDLGYRPGPSVLPIGFWDELEFSRNPQGRPKLDPMAMAKCLKIIKECVVDISSTAKTLGPGPRREAKVWRSTPIAELHGKLAR
jgi:hypothetical protein